MGYQSNPHIINELLLPIDNSSKRLFPDKDIQRILDNLPNVKSESARWVILFGIFTGARMEEICRLQTEDFVLHQGVWLVSFCSEEAMYNGKTLGSPRTVPVSPVLVDLGLPDFLDRRTGDLFADLTKSAQNGKYSHEFSKWFGRWRQKVGVTSEKAVFHALRNALVDRLFAVEESDDKRRWLVGHTTKTSHERYHTRTNRANALKAYPTIAALDWSDIDFTPLMDGRGGGDDT